MDLQVNKDYLEKRVQWDLLVPRDLLAFKVKGESPAREDVTAIEVLMD